MDTCVEPPAARCAGQVLIGLSESANSTWWKRRWFRHSHSTAQLPLVSGILRNLAPESQACLCVHLSSIDIDSTSYLWIRYHSISIFHFTFLDCRTRSTHDRAASCSSDLGLTTKYPLDCAKQSMVTTQCVDALFAFRLACLFFDLYTLDPAWTLFYTLNLEGAENFPHSHLIIQCRNLCHRHLLPWFIDWSSNCGCCDKK